MTQTAAGLRAAPLLASIADQAPAADDSRSVSAGVIDALKASDLVRLSAAREIGGLAATTLDIGRELEAVAGACASTAWCLWNHLATFHLFCGLLGPANAALLQTVVAEGRWVCFPAGAGTATRGRIEGDSVLLHGKATFGTGARYADHVGVSFVLEGQQGVCFALVETRQAGVRIDPDWKAMSLRASATDSLAYERARASAAHVVPFPPRFRETLRDPAFAVISGRCREDWVALSDLWLGWMCVGVAQAALTEACDGIQDRRALLGVKMIERPSIHANLGRAGALIASARRVVRDACGDTDRRIAEGRIPTEDDYLEQMAAGMMAADFCGEAMALILRVLGGNGLREGPAFERRHRDFQAMPLHINAHPDRISEQYGRNLLGLPTENPF